jgi:probable F420-dependent oxidoreductase
MRFTIGLPSDRVSAPSEFVTGDAIMAIAHELELLGYDACCVTDHPAGDARWLAAGGHHSLDPFVILAFAAASTTRLRLHTHVLIPAYRNPLLCAKSVLSLDVLAGGRVILGVAAGYLRSEFDALGVELDERNELTDEAIDVLRLVWASDAVAYTGRHFESRAVTMRPRSPQEHLPIWIGGNSTRAIRRVVERGDGWSPFPNVARLGLRVRTPPLETWEQFEARLGRLWRYAEEAGRTGPIDVCFPPFALQPAITGTEQYDAAAVIAELHRLADMGVTWSVLNAPEGATRDEYLAGARQFAETVMGPYRASL